MTGYGAGLRTDVPSGVHAPSLRFPSLPTFPGLPDELLRCPLGRDLLAPIISVYLISQNTLSTQNNNGPTAAEARGWLPFGPSCTGGEDPHGQPMLPLCPLHRGALHAPQKD